MIPSTADLLREAEAWLGSPVDDANAELITGAALIRSLSAALQEALHPVYVAPAAAHEEEMGQHLYAAFWARQPPKANGEPLEVTPWHDQAKAIRSMWVGIAKDSAALRLASRPLDEEAVARVIDPEAFDYRSREIDGFHITTRTHEKCDHDIGQALAKARAIIAMKESTQ